MAEKSVTWETFELLRDENCSLKPKIDGVTGEVLRHYPTVTVIEKRTVNIEFLDDDEHRPKVGMVIEFEGKEWKIHSMHYERRRI